MCCAIMVSMLFCGMSVPLQSYAEGQGFEIVQETSEDAQIFRINNISKLNDARNARSMERSATNPLAQFAEDHPIGFNLELAKNSNYVVYQEQEINAIYTNDSGEWTDNEGYMTIYTAAYHQGYNVSGNARYLVTGDIVFHKTFKLRYEEQLIMNHSANGVFDSTGTESGTMSYHASLHNHSAYSTQKDIEKDVTENILPDYSQSSGVCFKFKWPEDLIRYNGAGGAQKVDIRNVYTNWRLTTSYYVIATNDTNVAVNYIHNEKILGDALSISFGAYGVSANIDIKGNYTPYYARPILIYNI